MKRRGLFLFIVATSSWLLCAFSEPRQGVSVAYDVSIFGGTVETMADGNASVMHADGGTGVFALRLEPSERAGSMRGFVRSPLEFHDDKLEATDVMTLEQEYGHSVEGQAEAAYHRLLGALRHHRPPVELSINHAGRAQVAGTAQLRRYDRCGNDLVRAAIDQTLVAAENDRDRQGWRRVRSQVPTLLQPQLREARIMMRLSSMEMVPAPNGSWTELARRNLAEPGNLRRNQHNWRFEQILAHGEEFLFEGEIGERSRSTLASICRELRPRRLPNTIRDTCRISAIFDRRDGWPIAVNISRLQETRNRSTSDSGMIFWRTAPLEGFVAPPNPCPDA